MVIRREVKVRQIAVDFPSSREVFCGYDDMLEVIAGVVLIKFPILATNSPFGE